MVKKCRCRRTHDWPLRFKTCPPCRESNRRSKKKRTAKRPVKYVPPGHRKCTGCTNVQPKDQFRCLHVRQTELVAQCLTCRDSKHRSAMSPNTIRGQCRQVWLQWKKDKVCVRCGTDLHIEADHCRGGKKVWDCGDYTWWTSHGGGSAAAGTRKVPTPLSVLPPREEP